MGRSGIGLELAVLGSLDGGAVNTSVGGRRRSLTLELTVLDGLVVTEGRCFGLGLLVTLVGSYEAAGYLGGRQSLHG